MSHATKSDEFSKRFQTAVDPHPPPLRMVPISGNHVHSFFIIWPSYRVVLLTGPYSEHTLNILCTSYPEHILTIPSAYDEVPIGTRLLKSPKKCIAHMQILFLTFFWKLCQYFSNNNFPKIANCWRNYFSQVYRLFYMFILKKIKFNLVNCSLPLFSNCGFTQIW